MSTALRAGKLRLAGVDLEDRIVICAERFFQRSGCTKFPEVRYVAKRVGCRARDIEELESGGRYCLDGHNVEKVVLGDLEVYVMDPPERTARKASEAR